MEHIEQTLLVENRNILAHRCKFLLLRTFDSICVSYILDLMDNNFDKFSEDLSPQFDDIGLLPIKGKKFYLKLVDLYDFLDIDTENDDFMEAISLHICNDNNSGYWSSVHKEEYERAYELCKNNSRLDHQLRVNYIFYKINEQKLLGLFKKDELKTDEVPFKNSDK